MNIYDCSIITFGPNTYCSILKQPWKAATWNPKSIFANAKRKTCIIAFAVLYIKKRSAWFGWSSIQVCFNELCYDHRPSKTCVRTSKTNFANMSNNCGYPHFSALPLYLNFDQNSIHLLQLQFSTQEISQGSPEMISWKT